VGRVARQGQVQFAHRPPSRRPRRPLRLQHHQHRRCRRFSHPPQGETDLQRRLARNSRLRIHAPRGDAFGSPSLNRMPSQRDSSFGASGSRQRESARRAPRRRGVRSTDRCRKWRDPHRPQAATGRQSHRRVRVSQAWQGAPRRRRLSERKQQDELPNHSGSPDSIVSTVDCAARTRCTRRRNSPVGTREGSPAARRSPVWTARPAAQHHPRQNALRIPSSGRAVTVQS